MKKVSRKLGRPADVQPDINVTPLVDVVLVLLIIFMVVAPRLEQDIPIDLPGIFNPDPDVKGSMDPLKVTVARAGEYHIEDRVFDLEGAIEFLSASHAEDPMRRLVLRADAKLTYGDVRDIFARCQKVGFPGMALLVGERHKPGAQRKAGEALIGSVERTGQEGEG